MSEPNGREPGTTIVETRDLTRVYQRPRQSLTKASAPIKALRGVNLKVGEGERFGIVGESGSGKSTLIRLIAGLDKPTDGEVYVHGKLISGKPERALKFLRRDLQIVFQDPMSSLDPRMKVRDIIAEPLVALGEAGVTKRVEELVDAVGLNQASLDRYPHQFSGGQRQRISIARALSPKPSVLVADEPVSALDVSVRAQILNLIGDLVDEYRLTLIFVSHDLAVVRRVCERVAVLHNGLVVEQGPVEDVWDRPRDDYTKALLDAVPTLAKALAARS